MIGTKIYKKNFDAHLYNDCAIWCNQNRGKIVEYDEYYKVEMVGAENHMQLSQEPYVDPDRLAVYEAMAAQEARLTEIEETLQTLKGGEGK